MTTSAKHHRLATRTEAAEYLSCSIDTIRRRISDGTITGYRFGPRKILIDLDEVDEKLRVIPTVRT